MSKRLVLLFDSTVEAWDADLGRIQSSLAGLAARGVDCDLIDTNDISDQDLDHWRNQATTAAVWRHQRIRQVFGSRKAGRLPYLGKQVPALLLYEEGETIPVGVYPHSEKRRETLTDFTIQGFLQEFIDSLRSDG